MFDIVFKYAKNKNGIFISEQSTKTYNIIKKKRVKYGYVEVLSVSCPDLDGNILYVRGRRREYDEDVVLHDEPYKSELEVMSMAIIALDNNGIKVGIDFDGEVRRVDLDKCGDIINGVDIETCYDFLRYISYKGGFKCMI